MKAKIQKYYLLKIFFRLNSSYIVCVLFCGKNLWKTWS